MGPPPAKRRRTGAAATSVGPFVHPELSSEEENEEPNGSPRVASGLPAWATADRQARGTHVARSAPLERRSGNGSRGQSQPASAAELHDEDVAVLLQTGYHPDRAAQVLCVAPCDLT